MSMDPFSSALIGAVVSALLTEAITAARKAYHCKENCKKLLGTLEELKPLVDKAKNNSGENDSCGKYLTGFQDLLEEAKSSAKECAWTGNLMHVWRLRKLPSRILGVNDRIKDKIATSVLPTLDVVLSIERTTKSILQNQLVEAQVRAGSTTSAIEFQTQPAPKKVVGLEGHLEKLKAVIIAGHAKDNPSYLGLYGRGGAGKTVVAQKLNNDEDIRATYGADCISWITIGHDASVSSLYSTMGAFLGDGVFEREYRHRNEEDQRTYLTNAFSKKRMLLILDDVWEKQYNGRQLVDWLDIAEGPGSVTLITTREDGVLRRKKADVVVVLELSEEDSWELFCHHAFQTHMPTPEVEKIARNVCEECKGLPLALRVIGSAMHDKMHVGEWRSFLQDLKKSEANSSVVEELFYRLRLSYKELDEVTKKCFLYFAAFPEDYAIDINRLFLIWMADGLFGTFELNEAIDKGRTHLGILERRSLIDWDHGRKRAKVHDILRDFAIDILRRAPDGEWAWKCLFRPGSISKGIPMEKSIQEVERMSLIRCSMGVLPNHVQFPHLQVLLMSEIGSEERRLVVAEDFFKSMAHLRYLGLSENFFEGSRLPSFEGLKSLMILDLSYCYLFELPEGMGMLKSLTHLYMRGCKSLKELPKSIGELKFITQLDMNRCKSLKELPGSIGELKSLTHLNLRMCGSLKELPGSIEELKCLTHLDLNRCTSLKELPGNIGELKSLIDLNLNRCKSLKELPGSIGELEFLTHLNLKMCESLKELPRSIGELKSLTLLNLSCCESLKERLESIRQLKYLLPKLKIRF